MIDFIYHNGEERPMPSISQLKYIVTVERLKHFGKAAKFCNVTQPSLSIQIQKAEEELGVVIFDRNKKPVVATAKGQTVIEHAKAVLREHEKLMMTSSQDEGEVVGDLVVGIIPTILPYLLPLFLARFSETYPKLNLIVEEMKTEDIVDALRTDQIDAGILATPLKEKGIRERVLYYEEFLAYFHKGHPLGKKKKIDSQKIGFQDIWLLKDGHCLRNQVSHLCTPNNSSRAFHNFKFEGSSLETLRNLIRTSQGYTLVPWTFVRVLSAEEQKENTRRFFAPVPLREVSLVYSREQWKKELIDALRSSIVSSLPADIKQTYDSKNKVVAID